MLTLNNCIMRKKIDLKKLYCSLCKSAQKSSFLLRSVLVIAMVLAFANSVSARFTTDGWEFIELPDGTASIGAPVSEIWEGTNGDIFRGLKPRILQSMSFPSSITEKVIDNEGIHIKDTYTVTAVHGGFSTEQDQSLVHVSFPITVNSIGSWAFADCVNLNNVVLPEIGRAHV